jgi:hypothetical protein
MSKKIPDTISTIMLDSTGERTKSRFVGTFKIKRVLTHGDRFALERFYNMLLPKGMEVQEELKIRAAAIAELGVRIIEAPEWWDGSHRGQDLIDSDVIYDLVAACAKAESEWTKELDDEVKGKSNAIDPNTPKS